MRSKEVQIIPWVIADSNYVRCPSQRLEPHNTVFVGALHGMLNAEGLAHIFNDLFGGVVYAGIDTDKHKYPIGIIFFLFINQFCLRIRISYPTLFNIKANPLHWVRILVIILSVILNTLKMYK